MRDADTLYEQIHTFTISAYAFANSAKQSYYYSNYCMSNGHRHDHKTQSQIAEYNICIYTAYTLHGHLNFVRLIFFLKRFETREYTEECKSQRVLIVVVVVVVVVKATFISAFCFI